MRYYAALLVSIFAVCAVDMPDIGLSNSGWKLDEGIRIEGETMIIAGDGKTYRKAQLVVPAESFGNAPFFLVGEVKLESVNTGAQQFHAPKFKIYHFDDEKIYLANNVSAGGSVDWIPYAMKYQIKKGQETSKLIIEVAMQECSGTFRVRSLRFSAKPPVLTGNVFPFAAPDGLVCTIDIVSGKKKRFTDALLGANSQFMENPDYGYDHPDIGRAVVDSGIALLRFPGGTVANWYDWTADTYAVPAEGDRPPKHTLYEKAFGYPGYAALCKKYSLATIQMFNILHDSPGKSAARLSMLIKDGMRPAWVELGNENDQQGQQSVDIHDVAAYIAKAKAVREALRAVDPSIKYAVNISHGNIAKNEWASALVKDRFYDAVVMHPYVWLGLDGTAGVDFNIMQRMLKSYLTVKHYINDYRSVFGHTPLLLSEWGVAAPMNTIFNQLAVLGTMDAFMAILENADDGLVEMASLHIFFGNFMGMYYVDKDKRFVKRGYAVAYRLLSDTFRGTDIFDARSAAPELTPGLPAVLVRAAAGKDGIIRIFAVNKTPKVSTLAVSVDGTKYQGAWSIRSFSETDITARREYVVDDDPTIQHTGSGNIVLPPSSISAVMLK